MFCKVNALVGKLSLGLGHFCDKTRVKHITIITNIIFKYSFENILKKLKIRVKHFILFCKYFFIITYYVYIG